MANVTFARDGNVLLEKVWRVISTANKTRWLSSCQSAPSLQIWMRNGISEHPFSSLFSKNPVEALASLVNKQTKHIAKVLDNHTNSCFIIATVSFLKRCFIISKHWALSNHKKYVFYYKCSPFWQRRFDQILRQNLYCEALKAAKLDPGNKCVWVTPAAEYNTVLVTTVRH